MRLRRTDPHTLAGAYALDALSEEDRERFERHLGVCESCRAEAASLRDAAGRLAEATAAVPPPRLRGQVLAEAARTRQQPPPVRVAERVRRSWHGVGWPAAPRLAVAIAGVGILVALALGTLLINDQHQLHMDEAQRSQIAAALPATECYQVWLMGSHRMKSAGKLPPAKQGMTPPMIVAGVAAGDEMGVT